MGYFSELDLILCSLFYTSGAGHNTTKLSQSPNFWEKKKRRFYSSLFFIFCGCAALRKIKSAKAFDFILLGFGTFFILFIKHEMIPENTFSARLG